MKKSFILFMLVCIFVGLKAFADPPAYYPYFVNDDPVRIIQVAYTIATPNSPFQPNDFTPIFVSPPILPHGGWDVDPSLYYQNKVVYLEWINVLPGFDGSPAFSYFFIPVISPPMASSCVANFSQLYSPDKKAIHITLNTSTVTAYCEVE